MGILGNYGESQWALANFTVLPECACICAFGSNKSVIGNYFHKNYKFKLYLVSVICYLPSDKMYYCNHLVNGKFKV